MGNTLLAWRAEHDWVTLVMRRQIALVVGLLRLVFHGGVGNIVFVKPLLGVRSTPQGLPVRSWDLYCSHTVALCVHRQLLRQVTLPVPWMATQTALTILLPRGCPPSQPATTVHRRQRYLEEQVCQVGNIRAGPLHSEWHEI